MVVSETNIFNIMIVNTVKGGGLYCEILTKRSYTVFHLFLSISHHLWAFAMTRLQAFSLRIVGVGPLVTLYVQNKLVAVTSHAYHLLTGRTVPRVAHLETLVGAPFRSQPAASLLALGTILSRLQKHTPAQIVYSKAVNLHVNSDT